MLWLNDVPEEGGNITEEAISIKDSCLSAEQLQNMVDSVQRLGQKMRDGKSRQIILRLSVRTVHD